VQVQKKIVQAGPEERIAQLESMRVQYVLKKNELEQKLAGIEARKALKQKDQAKSA
jgi:hypothetical protein